MNKIVKTLVLYTHIDKLLENKNKINERDICENASNFGVQLKKEKQNNITTFDKHKSDVVGVGVLDDPNAKNKYTNKLMSNNQTSNIKIPTSNSAITLIALIITIIVLLILAGVTLSMVMGESGLFGKANKAKEQTQISTAKEIIGMQVLENEAYKSTNDSKAKSDEELLQPIEDKLAEEGYKIENGKIKIGSTEIDIVEEIANASSGAIDKTKGKNDDSKNRTLAGTTEGYSYKNPVIPQGFKAVDEGTAKWTYTDKTQTEVTGWDEGLVIRDTIGNEFVWVPVDGTNVKYAKWCTLGKSYAECSDDADAIPVTENAQINTYQGFYVARYEAGLTTETLEQNADTNNNTNSTAVSKPGTKIWNYINYNNANTVAQAMINNSETYGTTKSGLVTGTQWDTIMNWYENADIKVDTTQDWGTYRDLTYSGNGKYFTYTSSGTDASWSEGTFTRTGNSAYSSYPFYYHASGLNANGIKKNIADLGGNVWEWTAEIYSNSFVNRGGIAISSTADSPASCRYYNSAGSMPYNLGFRVVLYIQ